MHREPGGENTWHRGLRAHGVRGQRSKREAARGPHHLGNGGVPGRRVVPHGHARSAIRLPATGAGHGVGDSIRHPLRAALWPLGGHLHGRGGRRAHPENAEACYRAAQRHPLGGLRLLRAHSDSTPVARRVRPARGRERIGGRVGACHHGAAHDYHREPRRHAQLPPLAARGQPSPGS